MSESDYIACVIVGRDHPSKKWELITNALRKSIAWRSAFFLQDQERNALGHKHYQAAVQTREDYDSKSNRLLKPPEGFEELILNEAVEVYVETPPAAPEPVIPPKPPKQSEPQMAEVGPLMETSRPKPSTKMVYTEPEL